MPIGLGRPSQKCVCEKDACRKLSQLFWSIGGDVRCGFFSLPKVDVERSGDIKSFRLRRIHYHMNLKSDVVTQDGRNRSTRAPALPPSPPLTRAVVASSSGSSKKKKVERKVAYIARHHYYPEVLQEYIVNQNNTSSIDYIHADFVKKSNLLGNGYSEEDRFIGKLSATGQEMSCFVPVPSYSLQNAQRDYVLASARYRLSQQVVEVVSKKFRGESFLASRKEVNDDALKMLDKLPKCDPNSVEHLQRVVCMQQDEINELKQRIQSLEAK